MPSILQLLDLKFEWTISKLSTISDSSLCGLLNQLSLPGMILVNRSDFPAAHYASAHLHASKPCVAQPPLCPILITYHGDTGGRWLFKWNSRNHQTFGKMRFTAGRGRGGGSYMSSSDRVGNSKYLSFKKQQIN